MEANDKMSAGPNKRSPASEDVESRLICCARKLMFVHGYENVTTDMLAREANVSKATIYRIFSSKADLMGRMVNAESERIFDGIPDRVGTATAFRDALQNYGERFLDLVLSPEKIAFERTLLGKADELPQGARLFFANAHIGTRDRLASFISIAQENDKARTDLPASRLAEHLLMLWKGLDHCALQLGLPAVGKTDRKIHVSECIDLVFPATQ
jgi:AcrR family transcriptional regulator